MCSTPIAFGCAMNFFADSCLMPHFRRAERAFLISSGRAEMRKPILLIVYKSTVAGYRVRVFDGAARKTETFMPVSFHDHYSYTDKERQPLLSRLRAEILKLTCPRTIARLFHSR